MVADTLQRRPRTVAAGAFGLLLLGLGLADVLHAGWGFGLFLVAGLLLGGGVAVFACLALTRRFDTAMLQGMSWWLLVLGAWCYVYAVCVLAGYYTHETLAGRMELRWIIFGPAVLAALVVLDYGLYRAIVLKNLPTWQRFGGLISREGVDPQAMRRTLVDDVILHRQLREASPFRWLKHTLIFWGFMLMFATDVLAVVVREGFHNWGFTHIWEIQSHPVRLAFDFAFDFTGLMILVGCILSLAWRVKVEGTEERKFADTPTVVFLLVVVTSGFLVEAMRIAGAPHDPLHAVSFVGYSLAAVTPAYGEGTAAYELVWIVHALLACLFIAYVPIKRLVHSCATPLGRMAHSQRGLLERKRRAVLTGLMARRG